jgi:hypothetical protein
MNLYLTLALLAALGLLISPAGASTNLLLNPQFAFHSFDGHRSGASESFRSRQVAYWNTEAWGDLTVTRESHVDAGIRPAQSVGSLVSLAPGKRMWQFATLPELGLGHGDKVSLRVHGWQSKPGALKLTLKVLKLDSADGEWSPSEFGISDKNTYPRHSRGELVVSQSVDATSDATGAIELTIPEIVIEGRFHTDGASHSDDVNAIALQVEMSNASADGEIWVWAPCLSAGPPRDDPRAWRDARTLPAYYRSIPRTMQKLWKGEAIHILAMGSSIDRGSANPRMYLYDEDPVSLTFKHPLAQGNFDASKVNRPDLDGYFGWWQHYFSYTGRLRMELMRKFNLPAAKVCLNVMACDGSCVGEAHSGLKDYCSLSLPPRPDVNGQAEGKTWQELYPDLFTRPGGPGPDLVIFGSGANEKTDTPDEVAVFEGMIRWIQRHYPGTEFLFCMWQNNGTYTANVGDLAALALRYQIPIVDCDTIIDGCTRWCSRQALVPRDGHPQAAAHYIWSKQLEKAFECEDPIEAGIPQLQLPERLHPNSYGWEGEMVTFRADSPRIKGAKFVLEDTAVNCWGTLDETAPVVTLDGQKVGSRGKSNAFDLRNSVARYGRLALGDRHILEIGGTGAKLTAVDSKVCPDRQYLPVSSPQWDLQGAAVGAFTSEWGAPYGDRKAALQPGSRFTITVLGTDLSVAYVDTAEGGTLKVTVDGTERLSVATNVPFVDLEQRPNLMENRRGIRGLPWGLHTVQLEASDGPVSVLGLYVYDSRSNRQGERHLSGYAAAGETLAFTAPFAARPTVRCGGGLQVSLDAITPQAVTFGGAGTGWYEVVGQ